VPRESASHENKSVEGQRRSLTFSLRGFALRLLVFLVHCAVVLVQLLLCEQELLLLLLWCE
jgi:hypothetical protein